MGEPFRVQWLLTWAMGIDMDEPDSTPGMSTNFIRLWRATVPVLRNEEGDRSSRPSVSPRASHTMDVGFNIIREVVDEHQTHLVKTWPNL
jgi:hypothetical protein